MFIKEKFKKINLQLNLSFENLSGLNQLRTFILIPKILMNFYNKQKGKTKMAQRRAWTEEEDRALKYLKDTLKVKKWSQISRRLEFQYNLPVRNGKQCRERYTNHLDSAIIFEEFTQEDQEKLFKLHDKIGNKWSLISKQFTGRTDNHIKNHFHSKLRKAVRKINKQIKQHFKKAIKPYKLNIIYKVVQASDFRLSNRFSFDQESLMLFNELKNLLLQYAGGMVEKTNLSSMKGKDQALFMISKFELFEKLFKNKQTAQKSDSKDKQCSEQKTSFRSNSNRSTSNSECSSDIYRENSQEEIDDQADSIFEDDDGSLQFIIQHNIGVESSKSMEDEKSSSAQEKHLQNKQNQVELSGPQRTSFYSFSKNQKQNLDINKKFQNIPTSLIEQTDFSDFSLDRKFLFRSFQSLREYEDNLNDSQINVVLKKFDSYSDIEAGLFE